MAKIAWQGITLPIFLLALPLGANAQDAAAVLQPVAEALRIGEVERVELVASGSGYEERSDESPPPASAETSPAATAGRTDLVDPASPMYVPPPAPPERRYFRIVRRAETLDLAGKSLEIEQVRAESSAPDAETRPPESTMIGASADWSLRHRYWLAPHAFVAAALDGDAAVETETVDGTDYRVVKLAVDGGHEVRGYVDAEDRLVRIRTTVPGRDGETDVVESFFDWADQGELTFPSTLIRKENGALVEVLIIQEIDGGTSG